MTLALRYAVRSDVGLLREGNEDSAYAGPCLLAIADGMGGHAAGEVASAVAISALAALDHEPAGDLLDPLAEAVAEANITLHEMSVADPSVEGMGTTLTAMLWQGSHVALCHIGDSRAYMLRDGELFQITRDHTLVQSLVDEGRLTPQAAASHPQRSLLLRALDGRTEADPDLSIREARFGDRYLLCSDGLSDVVTDQTLHKTLQTVTDPDDAVMQLIELAIRSGGPDNITCIVADVVDTDTGPVPPSRAPVVVGAASNTDGRPPLRTDSPASRAHQLTQVHSHTVIGTRPGAPVPAGSPGPGQGSTIPGSTLPPAGDGAAAAAAAAAGGAVTVPRATIPGRTLPPGGGPGQAPGGAHRAPDSGPPTRDFPAANGPVLADEEPVETRYPRRRWPVVSFLLVLLLLLISGGGFLGWRYIQGQYYVGTDGHQVVIFRGINEKIIGISLSSVYRRTGIPLTHVVANDRQQVVDASIPPSNLTKAESVVTGIRHDYTCQQANADLAEWVAHKPKSSTKIVKKRVNGKIKRVRVPVKYRAKPVIPSYCPPSGGTG
jgi:PPM family protein phosphatase